MFVLLFGKVKNLHKRSKFPIKFMLEFKMGGGGFRSPECNSAVGEEDSKGFG